MMPIEMARLYFVRQAQAGRRAVFETEVATAWPGYAKANQDGPKTVIEGFEFVDEKAAASFDLRDICGYPGDYFETWDDALEWMRAC